MILRAILNDTTMLNDTGTSPMIQRTSTLSRGRHTFVVVAECETNSSKARRRITYRVPRM